MNYVVQKHSQFVRDLKHATKLFTNPLTAVPSALFLLFSAVVLYYHFHRFTTPYTRWHTRLRRELLFQWVYFYVTRGWFLIVRLFKLVYSQLHKYIMAYVPERDQYLNIILTKLLILTMVFGISLIPVLVFFMRFIYRDNVPNFLIWVGEDPSMRTEMGTSGRFLSRTARFPELSEIVKTKENPYRSRRSASVDAELWKDSKPALPRNCKSMLTLNAVTLHL